MKLILNNSTIEIVSRERGNRHKKVVNFVINSNNRWVADANAESYFVDAKAGDTIVVTPPIPTASSSEQRFLIAFTSTDTPENDVAVSFANGTSERIRNSVESTFTVSENCYLFVLETQGTSIWKPNSIVINGLTLDENGWLQ